MSISFIVTRYIYIYIYIAVACFSYVTNTLTLMQVSCQRRFITETWRASSPARPGVGYPCSWRFILQCAGDTGATCSAHHFTCYSAGEYIHAAPSRALFFFWLRHAILGLSYVSTPQVVLFLYKKKLRTQNIYYYLLSLKLDRLTY